MQKQLIRQVYFYSKKGVKLAGEIYQPAHISPKETLPAILLCQGLCGDKSVVLPAIAQAFIQKRFIVLSFDYSGFGESKGERGCIDPMSRVEDALSALTYLRSLPHVNPRRVGIYGLSLGGGIAPYLAIHDDFIQAVVVVSGFGSGEKLLRSLRTNEEWIQFKEVLEEDRIKRVTTGRRRRVSIEKIFPFSKSFQRKYADLKEGEECSVFSKNQSSKNARFSLESADFMMRYDITQSMRMIEPCPILFIHGAKDTVVPVEDILEVYQQAGDHKEIIILDDYDHIGLDHGIGLSTQTGLALDWFCQYV